MKIIAVDFDGTLCRSNYPALGEPIQYVIDKLLFEQLYGAKIILWTCREGKSLVDAVKWCYEHGIVFDSINESLPEEIGKGNKMYGKTVTIKEFYEHYYFTKEEAEKALEERNKK